jgi:cell division topological specificity factor
VALAEVGVRLLDFFKLNRQPPSAATAKQRLQVIIAHERTTGAAYDFLPLLQRELLEVIRKYVEIDPNKVKVDIEKGESISVLEVNIELPPTLARSQLV